MQIKRSLGLSIAGVVLIAALVFGFLPRAIVVDVQHASRAPLTVTVEEEGQTRVIDRYVVSAPVAGFARRIALDVGDPVEAGEVLMELEPLRSDVLDPRSRAEAEAQVASAQSALLEAEQQITAARADEELSRLDLERKEKLREIQYVSEGELDRAVASARSAKAKMRSAVFGMDVAKHELEAAQTTLEYSAAINGSESPERVAVTAPVSGRVLRLIRESEGVVTSGQALLEIGNPKALEVEVDVLSADAVRITTGMPVLFYRWGGETPLEGVVRVVEPTGFRKISALGVEEQRVWVISDITSPPGEWERLGDGYRVETSFVLWHDDDVLQVPASALFRESGDWAVYRIIDGRARLTMVKPGRRNGLSAEVTDGLSAGDAVIIHPGDDVADGVRVRPR